MCVRVCVFVGVGVWVCMVCVYLCVWYMYDVCTYTLVNSCLLTWLVLVVYNIVCVSVRVCVCLCNFTMCPLILVLNMGCVYMCVHDVKICVHMHGV